MKTIRKYAAKVIQVLEITVDVLVKATAVLRDVIKALRQFVEGP